MKTKPASQWDLASLVDLEITVAQEKGRDDTEFKHRDRMFFKRYAGAGGSVSSRARAFRAWVEERRNDLAAEIPTPGQEAEVCLGWIKSLGSAATFLLGATWAWGALTVHEAHGAPVNVLTFWFLTIGIPLLLTLAGFRLLSGWRPPHLPRPPLVLKRLLAKLLVSGVLRTEHLVTDRIGAAREAALRASSGELSARFADRHGLLSSLLANTLHILGLGMVLGIFAALFAFKNFSNQDYGWQSDAACVTPARVEGFVGLISLPWTAVFGGDAGHPTTREIEGTRFFRNEGVKGMDHAASINWSSFLVLSSLFWGVLPRVILCVAGRLVTRRQLHAEDFSQHRFDALWRRMTRPDLTMEPAGSEEPQAAVAAVLEPDLSHAQGTKVLLLPQELASDELRRNVTRRLESQYGCSPHEFRSMPSLPSARALLVAELTSLPDAARLDLHILQESFMPPVKEFRTFLGTCRARLGAGASIRVVLIGERTGAGTWAGPSARDQSVWNDKLAAIGDPRISLLTLEPSEIN